MANEIKSIKGLDKTEKTDLKISGSGSAGGGSYNEVSISGSGEINGDIDCRELKTSGASKVNGSVKSSGISTSGVSKISGSVETDIITTSGSCEVGGDVSAGEVKSSGSTKIGGSLKTKIMNISGAANIGGSIHAEEVKISGAINIGQDCETERFNACGGFKIGGLLNSDQIEIKIGGGCRVREIGGEKINIRRSIKEFFGIEKILRSIFHISGELEVDTIEGDEIYLEATKARVIRGNNVTIGEDCDIENVEYTGTLNISQGAKVKNQKKV